MYFSSVFCYSDIFFVCADVSSLVFNLEDNLPDELVSSGNNWADNLGGNKSTGPPGSNQQMNGEDPGVPSVAWNQHQRQGSNYNKIERKKKKKNEL